MDLGLAAAVDLRLILEWGIEPMANYVIRSDVWKSVANFRLPETLGFGLVLAPVMYSATFENGRWNQGELVPYGPIEILPGARALHFAEQAFEGMKAYRVGRSAANFFSSR